MFHQNKKLSIVIFLYLILLACTIPLEAATYYVATSGNNVNPGTQVAPWKTIQKAADTMLAGDTVLVQPGAYPEKVLAKHSGTAGALITFKANGSGVSLYGFIIDGYNYIIVDGFDISIPRSPSWDEWENGSGIALINAKYCELKNNYIHHTLREGICLDSSTSNYNKIINNTIAYAGGYAGIVLDGKGNKVENNDISHTLQHPLYPTLSTAGGPDADGIKISGSGHQIVKNYIHDILMSDTGNVNPHIDILQASGSMANITIEKNFFSNSNNGMQGIYFDGNDVGSLSNITVKNNIITSFRPLSFWTISGLTIEHNVVGCWNSPTCDYVMELHETPNVLIMNNVFFKPGRNVYLDSISRQGLNMDYNAYYSTGSGSCATTAGTHGLCEQNPQFVNAAIEDFHLQSSSPLIDAGATLNGVADDIDGIARPRGAGYDIGAYEFNSCTFGDINGDTQITAYDAALAAQTAVALITLTPIQIVTADVDGTTTVDSYDAALIAQYAVGLITRFPVEG